MLNLNYLKFLFKSKRYFNFFILLVTVLSCLTLGKSTAVYFNYGLAICLAYFMPVYIFSYVHDKKAIDSYYCLPISRKELLVTGLLYSFIIAIIPYILGTVIACLLDLDINIDNFLYMLVVAVSLLGVIAFNGLTYLTGHNKVDGIIMMAAYNVFPLLIAICIDYFTNSFVAGANRVYSDLAEYLSPIALSVILFSRHMVDDVRGINFSLNNKDFIYIGVMLLLLVISFILLYFIFMKRKVEKAGSCSDKLYAYPFIIYSYTFLGMFGLCCEFASYSTGQIFEYVIDNFIFYLIIFIMFVCAHFIYKRKFYFSIKMPIFFIGVLILTMVFSTSAKLTKGFGLANIYVKDDPSVQYELTIYDNEEVIAWASELTGKEETFASISITVGHVYTDDPLSKEMIDIFEGYRKKAIEDFYDEKEKQWYGYLQVTNNASVGNEDYRRGYDYTVYNKISVDTILKIANYPNARVTIDTNDAIYKVDGQGNLTVVEYYKY